RRQCCNRATDSPGYRSLATGTRRIARRHLDYAAQAAPLAARAAYPKLAAVLGLVDISSGMSLASHSNSGINPETAAAYNTEVVKQKLKAMSALKLQAARGLAPLAPLWASSSGTNFFAWTYFFGCHRKLRVDTEVDGGVLE
nr:hypothetical protein [Tanacetum cinerariifolium]